MPDNHKEEIKKKRRDLFLRAVESLRIENPTSDIDEKTGYGRGNISKILTEKMFPSPGFIARFEKAYNISISDLDDDYPEGNDTVNVLHEAKATESKSDLEIPLYDIEVTAGVVSLFRDPKSYTPIDTIKIPNMPNCDGALFVTGDSMYPLIKSGDIVLYKSITEIPQSVFFGNMYLVSVDVEGDEMVMVKYVQRGKDENHILLVSENKHHADKEVHITNINGMALVKASVRFNSLT